MCSVTYLLTSHAPCAASGSGQITGPVSYTHLYDGNHVAMGLTQLLLTVIIMVINQKFFISGVKGLRHRAPNMDTLVALGSSAAFIYSTYALLAMTGAQVRGDEEAVMRYMMDFYFESAAMILTRITVGKMLEDVYKRQPQECPLRRQRWCGNADSALSFSYPPRSRLI